MISTNSLPPLRCRKPSNTFFHLCLPKTETSLHIPLDMSRIFTNLAFTHNLVYLFTLSCTDHILRLVTSSSYQYQLRMVLDNYLQVRFLLFHRQLAVVQSPEFLKLEQAGAAVVVSGATVVVSGATVVVVVVVAGAKVRAKSKYDVGILS